MHDHLINSIALSLHSQACRKPSFLCRHSSVCLSEAQLCDGKKDCPEGDDEFCPGACLSIGNAQADILVITGDAAQKHIETY